MPGRYIEPMVNLFELNLISINKDSRILSANVESSLLTENLNYF